MGREVGHRKEVEYGGSVGYWDGGWVKAEDRVWVRVSIGVGYRGRVGIPLGVEIFLESHIEYKLHSVC